MSISHQQQNRAILNQFDQQAPSYTRLTLGGTDLLRERLLDALRPAAADALLDVGCGGGRLTLSLAQAVGHATGIDLTPAMIEQARALQAELNISNVHWQQGDILPLPFADASFTIAVTQATFHHLVNPGAVLAEMTRVVAPGGRIAVIDMTFEPVKAAVFDPIEKRRDPSHLRVLSTQALRDLGHEAGLEEISHWHYRAAVPAEAVLATSFPAPGDLDRVRDSYREDAHSGADRLGLQLRIENGAIIASYPMTMLVWRRA
jgi:ubiquinone/menaquinone biosynthesis C-methylase UbiE